MHRPMVMPGMALIMMAMMHDHHMMPMVIIAGLGIGCGQNDNGQRDEGCCQDLHYQSPWVPEQTSGWGGITRACVLTNATPDNAIAPGWFQVAFK